MGAIDDTRKLFQDFLAPELREVNAKLQALTQAMADGHKYLAEGQKSLAEGQKDTELRLLREIARSEEKILLMLKVADLSSQNAELIKRAEEKIHPSAAQ